MHEKIKSLDELAVIGQNLKAKGHTIVHCHGVFDLVHPGHIRYFQSAAKRENDILIVTVTRDEHVNKGPGRPVFNHGLRLESLAALECIDYVALSEGATAIETILKIKPDLYVKGPDYQDVDKDLTGAIKKEIEAVKSVGGNVRFINDITFSSTELLNTYFGVYDEGAERFLKQFKKRYTADQIIQNLQGLKPMKALVVGETIIDEYYYCRAMGKPPKEILISAKYESHESFAGGVLACANHLAGFLSQVDVVTCLGSNDSKEEFIRKHLKSNVTPHFFYRPDSGTIVKRRFVDPAFLTKMFEVSFVNDTDIPPEVETAVGRHLEGTLAQYDLVVMIDYGHGFIKNGLAKTITTKAPFLAVNTQSNSLNLGYNTIFKYPRVDYISLDDPEIRLAARNRYGDIKEIIQEVSNKIACRTMTVTRGKLGSLSYSKESGFTEVPAFSKKIVDTLGAGDAYLALTAPCAAKGFSEDQRGFIGNAVGAMAVGYVGNKTFIEPTPLFKFIEALLH